jgi:hypothetical protein
VVKKEKIQSKIRKIQSKIRKIKKIRKIRKIKPENYINIFIKIPFDTKNKYIFYYQNM